MLPPRAQYLPLQVELLPRLAEKAPVPLFRGDGRLAEGGEIEKDYCDAFPAKARRRTDHERALAYLSRRQNITELAAAEERIEIGVRLALHVGRSIGAQ